MFVVGGWSEVFRGFFFGGGWFLFTTALYCGLGTLGWFTTAH